MTEVHRADPSWRGKLRRRAVRLAARRPAQAPSRPMISFAFDDAPLSAARSGADILERRGIRGSFYVAASLADADGPMGRIAGQAAIARLARAGHEIGCHTFSHLDCGQASACEAVEDAARNASALTAWGAPRPTTFAYPYGDVSASTKRALAGRFVLLRALHHGLVRRGSDLNQAPAVGIEGPAGEAVARRWIARAAASCGWLILYTHDVAERHSEWGCSPGVLAALIEEAVGAGLEPVTVAEGARRVGSPVA